jgi:hypothetical protein
MSLRTTILSHGAALMLHIKLLQSRRDATRRTINRTHVNRTCFSLFFLFFFFSSPFHVPGVTTSARNRERNRAEPFPRSAASRFRRGPTVMETPVEISVARKIFFFL